MTQTQAAVLAGLVALAGAWDWKWRLIPNWITVTGVAAGLLLHSPLAALKGIGVALLVYVPLYLLRAVGGGDLKLMAAVGSIVGPDVWLVLFVLSAVLGGVAALVLVVAKGRLRRTLANVGHILGAASRASAPHAERPELDAGHPEALTLPRGTVIATAALLYLAAQRL